MSSKNICCFAMTPPEDDGIYIANFVYETEVDQQDSRRLPSLYSMHYVTEGKGIFSVGEQEMTLGAGDVFFMIPGVPCRLQSAGDLKYIYVSYLGRYGQYMMERYGVTASDCVFHGLGEVDPFWKRALEIAVEDSPDVVGESVLLYTFSAIGSKLRKKQHFAQDAPQRMLALAVKKLIDDAFTEPEISVETISNHLSYNKKYLSAVFKREIGEGICEYIQAVRIRHARSLMEQGVTCVKDIAFLCGFGDPMYFSKVFHKRVGLSPKEYILRMR